MKTINDIELKVIKNEKVYEIHVNNIRIDIFTNNTRIDKTTLTWLNSIFNTAMTRHQLQNYLIENYLEKDLEEMTNQEFLEYLLGNFKEFSNHRGIVVYENEVVYNILNDDINFVDWHNGLLWKKTSFCNFDHRMIVPSKGNRKKFIGVVKQVIKYFQKFEIKEKEISNEK